MKAIKILVILLVVLALAAAGGVWYLNRFLQSPDFQELARSSAQTALGSGVTLTELEVSLWRGVTLRGMAVANPPPFTGNLLTAESFVLRYRLLPLLRKHVAIQKLAIEKPVIALVRDQQGAFNYEKLGGTTAAGSPPTSVSGGGTRFNVDLSAIAIRDGEVSLASDAGKLLVKLAGLGLDTSVALAGDKMTGRGDARIAEINVANAVFVRNVQAPVTIGDEILLAPLTGQFAGGTLSGGLTVRTAGGFKYIVDLTGRDSDVATLLQEMGAKPNLTGKLQLTAKLEGTSGLPTITGGGKAEITNGQLTGVPLLNLLGTLLQVPELQTLQFNECLLEYTLANNVMQNPVIKLTSPLVQITGSGAMELENYTLNHTLTLALAESLLAKVPNEIRNAFTKRADGFLTIDFKVTGPYDAPKTDLSQRLLKGAGQQLLDKGLKKLFN